jgi:L-glutamine-phosphate cytidylyltransferase
MNIINCNNTTSAITTAVIPAAGNGNRLRPATSSKPKCLVEINGRPLLQYTIDALEFQGYTRLILVTGYRSEMIEAFTDQYRGPLAIDTVHNGMFDSTNNIYSVFLALQKLDSGFTLIESDLIFEPQALKFLKEPDTVALDRYDPSLHQGTTVTLSACGVVTSVNIGTSAYQDPGDCFKTVNIWTFSRASAALLLRETGLFTDRNQTDCFYEAAIRNLVINGQLKMNRVDFSGYWWDEIDTRQDLERVKSTVARRPLSLVV